MRFVAQVRAYQYAPTEFEAMARATLIGFSAVAMWALLALLTDASGRGAAVPAVGAHLCDRHLRRPGRAAGLAARASA